MTAIFYLQMQLFECSISHVWPIISMMEYKTKKHASMSTLLLPHPSSYNYGNKTTQHTVLKFSIMASYVQYQSVIIKITVLSNNFNSGQKNLLFQDPNNVCGINQNYSYFQAIIVALCFILIWLMLRKIRQKIFQRRFDEVRQKNRNMFNEQRQLQRINQQSERSQISM